MKIIRTELDGCLIIENTVFNDNRGYFFESFNRKKFKELVGFDIDFVQENQSFSKYGTIRGLHFQRGDAAQAKLVRVLAGRVLDVAVDIRPQSPSFGKHVAVELSSENNNQMFIPRGFAHGFSVLSESAIFSYKCDNYYDKQSEGGIYYKDSYLKIDWKLDESVVSVSEKDLGLPIFKEK